MFQEKRHALMMMMMSILDTLNPYQMAERTMIYPHIITHTAESNGQQYQLMFSVGSLP